MIKLFFTISLLMIALSGHSQTSATQKINEVYGADFFNKKAALHKDFLKLLSTRISYVVMPRTTEEKHPLISSIATLTKYNKNIPSLVNFDIDTFNPLFYSLNFFSTKTEVYRIDKTDYLLVIKPQ